MPSCIICHMSINEGDESYQECPNGHPTHFNCLKEWLMHSLKCPLCNEPYPQEVIRNFKSYIDKKEKEKQQEYKKILERDILQKIGKVADNIAFLKFSESIDILIEAKEYDYALSRLDLHDDKKITSEKGQRITFLRGKIYYLRERYDLAINQLFKLVKEKYDYPDGFLYLAKSYEALGLMDKAKWAYERVK
ncbi:MAG: RING finger domain-containing protein [Candidatus Thorarchaeota archaeon]